jgi:hypothetical protein
MTQSVSRWGLFEKALGRHDHCFAFPGRWYKIYNMVREGSDRNT